MPRWRSKLRAVVSDYHRSPVDASLREAYQSGSLVAFVGDGLSRAAGLPSRRELVETVLAIARDRGVYPSQLEDIELLVAEGDWVAALSELESALTPVAFTRWPTRSQGWSSCEGS
jgi:hypothetical protein